MIFPFFATPDDLCDPLEWMDGTGDFVFFEQDSRPDLPNRVFDCFPKAEFLAGDYHMPVSAWVKAAGSPPVARMVRFNAEARKELKASGRTFLESPAIIRFSRILALQGDYIAPVEFIYETEISAGKGGQFDRSQIGQTEWVALRAAVNGIKRRMKATSAGRWKSKLVMAGVAEELRTRPVKLWFWGDEGTI